MAESEFTLDELETAFALRVVHMVMTADEVVTDGEMEFLEGVFPPEVIHDKGYIDPSENLFTRRFSRAIEAAPDALSQWLSEDQKRSMIALFFKACEADGEVDPRELGVVTQAARMLGLSQEETIREVSRLLGTRSLLHAERRRRSGRPPGPVEPLVTTQGAIVAALSGGRGDSMDMLRRRIEGYILGEAGVLVFVVTPDDVRDGVYRGVEEIITQASQHEHLLSLSGRLGFAFDAWELGGAEPQEVPELRGWMVGLVARYPWLPVWMDPLSGQGGQLVAACVPEPVDDPVYAPRFIATAVQSANYAVALIHSLGDVPLDHVYEFLTELGMHDVPPGYFAGVDSLRAHLDPHGHALPK